MTPVCSGARPGPETERLPRSARLRRSRDIRALFRRGRRTRTASLEVLMLASGGTQARVGWVVPKLGRRIVDRNRLKRRLREIGRRRVLVRLREAGVVADVLVRARTPAYRASYGQLEAEVMTVVEGACSRGR